MPIKYLRYQGQLYEKCGAAAVTTASSKIIRQFLNPNLQSLINKLLAYHVDQGLSRADASFEVMKLIPKGAIVQSLSEGAPGNDFLTGFEAAQKYPQLHMVSFPEVEVWHLLDDSGAKKLTDRLREQLMKATDPIPF